MPDMEELKKNLQARGFAVSYFDTAPQAADYLDAQIDGTSVGIGGSMTVKELGLYDRLSAHNRVFWHWEGAAREDAANTEVYISSVNGLAQTGELINIDGSGNRLASTLFGHKKVYFVVGVNKLAPDYDGALWRARNIAAPKNALRFGVKTPCAAKGDRCYDCNSPERICRALLVLWEKPHGIPEMEVVLINQELGF